MRKLLPSIPEIQSELRDHQRYREALLAEIPDLDDETLTDTLEGLTDLREMVAALVSSALTDQALGSGLKQRLDEMRQRRQRLEDRAQKKRALVLDVMRKAEIDRIDDPEFTASLKKAAPSLLIENEPEIPEGFWLPQPAKLDRQGLLAALKSGADVPGASIASDGIQLSVRTR